MRLIVVMLCCLASLAQAGLDFPETLKEVRADASADKVTADFPFTNQSDKAVTVSHYDSTCSCMSVQITGGKTRYEPGESGVIRTQFDMGNFSGTVDKVVVVWLDDAPEDEPSVTLTVRVHIPVLVAMTPKTLKWEMAGKGEPQTIEIRMNHSEPIKVKSVTGSSEAFGYQLETIEEGKSYDLVVTPKTLDAPALGIFRVETDCELEKHRIQQAFGVIRRATAEGK